MTTCRSWTVRVLRTHWDSRTYSALRSSGYSLISCVWTCCPTPAPSRNVSQWGQW